MVDIFSPQSQVRFDGIQNLVTGMGTPAHDPSTANQIFIRRSLTQIEQSRLLQYGFLRKIVSKLPKATTAKWGNPTIVDGDPEMIADITKALNKIKVVIPNELAVTGVKNAFYRALFNAFLTGNGAIVIHTIEKKNKLDLSEPIELNNLKSIRKLVVLDRWQINPVMPIDQEEVTHFQMMQGGTSRIHASRVLWFDGEKLDAWGTQENQGCDESILDGIYDVFNQYAGGIQGAARMLQDFDVLDIAIKGLHETTKEQSELIRSRSKLNAQMQSLYRARIRDMDNEALTYATRSVGGYSELLTMLKDWMLANTEYPPAVLFGEFSTGLNASGKTQEERALWNDTIADLQETRLTHQLTGRHADSPGLLDILCACADGPTKGKTPNGLGWQWNPLYTPTPTEQADLEMNRAQLAVTLEQVAPGFANNYVNSAYGGNSFNPTVTLTPEYKQQVADAAALVQPPAPEGEVDEYGNPMDPAYTEEQAGEEEVPAEEMQADSTDWNPHLDEWAIDSEVRKAVKKGVEMAIAAGSPKPNSKTVMPAQWRLTHGGNLTSAELVDWRKFWRDAEGRSEIDRLLHGGRWGKVWCNSPKQPPLTGNTI